MARLELSRDSRIVHWGYHFSRGLSLAGLCISCHQLFRTNQCFWHDQCGASRCVHLTNELGMKLDQSCPKLSLPSILAILKNFEHILCLLLGMLLLESVYHELSVVWPGSLSLCQIHLDEVSLVEIWAVYPITVQLVNDR